MRKIIFHSILFVFPLSFIGLSVRAKPQKTEWKLILKRPHKPDYVVTKFDHVPDKKYKVYKKIKGLKIKVHAYPKYEYVNIKAEAEATTPKIQTCYFVLQAYNKKGIFYSFNGKVNQKTIFRQSPHNWKDYNIDIPKQAVPMIAVKTKSGFQVAISNAPAFYDNYTTQMINPIANKAYIASGDNGKLFPQKSTRTIVKAHYFNISRGHSHHFQAVIFQSQTQKLSSLRLDVFRAITKKWGQRINDIYGSIAFATNYMHYRKNDKGNSKYWIVPVIEYANKQYSRDAFWQTMVLPLSMEQQCYNNEAVDKTNGAERPLFALIWSYRIAKEGGKPDLKAAKDRLKYIQKHTKKGLFYAVIDTSDHRKSFQSWYDLCAFNYDDVVTYNQGLLAVALIAAKKLGLNPSIKPQTAVKQYNNLFNGAKGYYPLSRQKDAISMDVLVGDLLAQILFGRPLLKKEHVMQEYKKVINASRAKFGFKITSTSKGHYENKSFYDAKGFDSRVCNKGEGAYQCGGSWFLYDMLFLTDCYLRGISKAEDIAIWRTKLDFKKGGTYHEHINTVTGKAFKPNQGWDAAIYAIWKSLAQKRGIGKRYLINTNQFLKKMLND